MLVEDQILEGQSFPFVAKLLIDTEDAVTFNAIRRVLLNSKSDYKLFSKNYNCFIPSDPDLIVTEIGLQNNETNKALEHFKFKPIFYYQKTRVFYAIHESGSIAIINQYLLGFIYKKKYPKTKSKS